MVPDRLPIRIVRKKTPMTPSLIDRVVSKATAAVGSAFAQPETVASHEPEQLPYIGFARGKNGEVTGLARGLYHTLILAGSGAGKTRRLIVPSLVTWDGPALAVSAKSDVAEMSAELRRTRRHGPIYVMDLTGQADWAALPEDAIPLVSDPCSMLVPDADGSTDDAAMDMATLLTQLGSLGMGGGKGGGGDSAFWMTLALGVLACLLQAGHGYLDPDTDEWVDGGGIDWVLRAALNPGMQKTNDDDDDEEEEDLDLDTPSWDVARVRAVIAGSAHAAEITAAKNLDPKQRDSIGINLRVALSSWKKRTVRGRPGQKVFAPELLEDPSATMYLVSPSSGTAAGAAVSVIESVVTHWTLHAMTKKLPKISLILDEMPQIAPWLRAREAVGLMRSYGCYITIACQHSSQLTARFGKEEAEALIAVMPNILVGIGAIEKDIVEQAAWTVPPGERQVESTSHRGEASNSADRAESFSAAELLPKTADEALLIVRGRDKGFVRLYDYTEL